MSPKDHLLNSAARFGEHTTAHFTALTCAGTLELVCLPTIDFLVDKVHHLTTPEILTLGFAIFAIGWGSAHLRLQQFFKNNRLTDHLLPTVDVRNAISPSPLQPAGYLHDTAAVIIIIDSSRVKEAAEGAAAIINASRSLPPPSLT